MAVKGVNKATIVGNLGNDPKINFTPAGAQITSISVATSESWKDKNTGQVQEKTEWHNISFMGKLAEIAGDYLKKGSQVYIEGKLQTRKYQDKQTGADKYSTSIIVDSFTGVLQMLGSKQDGQQGQQQPQQNQGYQQQAPQQQQRPMSKQAAPQQNYQQQPNPANHQPMQGYAPQGGGFADGDSEDIPF